MELKLSKPIFLTFPTLNRTKSIEGELQREGIIIDKIELPNNLQITNRKKEKKEYLKNLVFIGFEKKYSKAEQEATKQRLIKELKIITDKGWIEYFLVLYNLIENIKQFTDISLFSANHTSLCSMVNYRLDVTNIDPMKFELGYEKFLKSNKLMVSIWVNESNELRKWFENLSKTLPKGYEKAKAIPPKGKEKAHYRYEDFREAEKIVIMTYDKEKTNIQQMIKENIIQLKN